MSQVQAVKTATSIVEVIGEKIKLDRSGLNYRGLCPFHGEKSPSFFVNEAMQRYRCFGCGASGDVFEFLQNYDGMTFAEALQYLAEKAGITLESFAPTGEDAERERLLGILDLTREYYHYLLTEHAAGEIGREYLKTRGIKPESVKLFQLGYALSSWDGLLQYLNRKKKYSLQDLEKAGLIIKGKNNRYYDRFRDRLMFPLRNHRGQVVGFSGRVLNTTEKEAKYINSPETSLYHKSDLLFGYSELFREIKKKQQVIVMEGELDLISSTQAHVNHVVAIKGSALTEAQIKLLGRAATQIVLALDADEAGIKATQRAIELIAATTLELRIIDFGHAPELIEAGLRGKDPDEIAKTNPKLWRELADQSISAYEFLLRAALEKYDPKTPEGKKHIIDVLAPIFSRITHAVEQDFYVQKLAEALNVRADLVSKDLARFAVPKTPGRVIAQPVIQKELSYTILSKRRQLEQYVLYLCLHSKTTTLAKRAAELAELTWEEPGAAAVIRALAAWKKPFEIGQFSASLAADLQSVVFGWYMHPQFTELADETAIDEEWGKQVAELKKMAIQTHLQQIQQKLATLDAKQTKTAAQEAEVSELLEQIVVWQQKLKV
jgi:DNA primase